MSSGQLRPGLCYAGARPAPPRGLSPTNPPTPGPLIPPRYLPWGAAVLEVIPINSFEQARPYYADQVGGRVGGWAGGCGGGAGPAAGSSLGGGKAGSPPPLGRTGAGQPRPDRPTDRPTAQPQPTNRTYRWSYTPTDRPTAQPPNLPTAGRSCRTRGTCTRRSSCKTCRRSSPTGHTTSPRQDEIASKSQWKGVRIIACKYSVHCAECLEIPHAFATMKEGT